MMSTEYQQFEKIPTTLITTTKDIYGPLHIDYHHPITIDNKEYKTISNYIYSNLQ